MNDLRPGDRIGAWVVDDVLGKGAMGVVYRAHHPRKVGEIAAVKVHLDDEAPDAVQRFLREAQVLASLEHRNIPRFLGFGEAPLHLAMEYVHGRPLSKRLADGPLPVEEALSITRQVAEALAHAHARGVWHRDVKPGNIVLGDDGVVKLVDFGVALVDDMTRWTKRGFLVGSLNYMPPEPFQAKPIVPVAWDLYALGVVLWQCLTGERPFRAEGEQGAARDRKIVRDKVNTPYLDPGDSFDADLACLVREMTARIPAQRLTSFEEVIRRVAALQAPGPRPPPPSRSPWALGALGAASGGGLAVGLAVVLLGVGAVVWRLAPVPDAPPPPDPPSVAAAVEVPVEPAPAPSPTPTATAPMRASSRPVATAPPELAPPPPPAPAPVEPEGPPSSKHVTNAELASFLESHPDWRPRAVKKEGRADEGFLQGWDGLHPPEGTERLRASTVPWALAKALCDAGRGGLAAAMAEPRRWSGPPAAEYRIDGQMPVLRRATGELVVHEEPLRTSPAIGFRCAR